MSEHTPGKLALFTTYAEHEIRGEGGELIATSMPHRQPDARRLVDCWNALEDLPQAALDGGWTRAGLEAYGLQMKAERDSLRAVNSELLDALVAITNQLERVGDTRPHKDGQFIDDARAAIASARKQGKQG